MIDLDQDSTQVNKNSPLEQSTEKSIPISVDDIENLHASVKFIQSLLVSDDSVEGVEAYGAANDMRDVLDDLLIAAVRGAL